ncbi:methyltransferase [Vibrio sp. SM6]|uniref:Ribosomal RNA large subunit methyltransferase G n=1 Tax=Vibrio agarilyticus TaxID=2726741 RepID=A0A7X8TQX3_9VIBR|nr:methyltransferase [Vibrio agarilyticus]
MKTQLQLLNRSLDLYRYPKLTNETLQAWDAGDEYLISHIESSSLAPHSRILILNDSFGALSCWFGAHHLVFSMTDSHIARLGIEANLAENGVADGSVTLLTSLDPWPENIDLVLMQLPKNNRYLTWQLHQLRTKLDQSTLVIAVNKARDIHSSTLKLFERYLGTTHTSLAWKKHRLVFAHANAVPVEAAPESSTWTVPEHGLELTNLSNVYSGESLDLGARFILEHLPKKAEYQNIIDLGCGNGVLSLKLAALNPQAHLTLVDESYMALASAKINLQRFLAIDDNALAAKATFKANNCLDGFAPQQADLVVCNPPFHQQQAVTDHIAWQMFCDAKRVLKTGGELRVIGNRHLGYDAKLKRLFGPNNVAFVASNSKFVILQATKA